METPSKLGTPIVAQQWPTVSRHFLWAFSNRAKDVEAAIRAKDLGPALRWCEDNASRLRKLESTLEFRVREKDFLEMVRENKREEVTLCFSCFL